ncbi:hypothetical protein T03_17296 [Trichinella britovi]|uniref:Uncharacterized protein n=1 Tax=Trichinella britovi TaxID=45882 RepID=A0A0V1CSP9_TRIBR|nr:hypothetical protein T03_17296 [Trichinella britovi]
MHLCVLRIFNIIHKISAEPEHRTMQIRRSRDDQSSKNIPVQSDVLIAMRYHHRCFETMAMSKYLSHISISNV